MPNLRLISQRGVYPHVDVDACTANGVLLSSDTSATGPSYATAELTWALFDVEPLTDPADDLLTAPGLVATPHIGFVTREDFET